VVNRKFYHRQRRYYLPILVVVESWAQRRVGYRSIVVKVGHGRRIRHDVSEVHILRSIIAEECVSLHQLMTNVSKLYPSVSSVSYLASGTMSSEYNGGHTWEIPFIREILNQRI
jgi:hypothetical protein